VLLDANGGPVAAGTRIRRPEGSAIVGYDGELWLEHYVDGETLQWSHAGQGCRVTLPPLPAAASPAPTLACQTRDTTTP
jgi:outer membrane usher protein FimD/PapC